MFINIERESLKYIFRSVDRLRPRSREWEGPAACGGRDRPLAAVVYRPKNIFQKKYKDVNKRKVNIVADKQIIFPKRDFLPVSISVCPLVRAFAGCR